MRSVGVLCFCRLALKRFHLEYCNLRANPSIPAKLSTFVPFCPPWVSFCPPLCSLRPFCPTPLRPLMMLPSSIASGFYPDIGSRSRPILHRLPSPSGLALAAVSASTASLSRLCMLIPAYSCLKRPIHANKLKKKKKLLYLCTRNCKMGNCVNSVVKITTLRDTINRQ